MNIFQVMGPVMIGPSSSHTAGAAKIGYIAGKLLGEPVVKAKIDLFGSFAATGTGHGTDRALVGGLLGMRPDDRRLPQSFDEAYNRGLHFDFSNKTGRADMHPNTVQIQITGKYGQSLEMEACSLGGGQVVIRSLDGLEAGFSGSCPALIVYIQDIPGQAASILAVISGCGINIASLRLNRRRRGGTSVLITELDGPLPYWVIHDLKEREDTERVTYYEGE